MEVHTHNSSTQMPVGTPGAEQMGRAGRGWSRAYCLSGRDGVGQTRVVTLEMKDVHWLMI